MESNNQLGMNRTGTDMSPKHTKAMLNQQPLIDPGAPDPQPAAQIRSSYMNGSSLGSVPLPGTVKGTLKTGMQKMTGNNPEVLINKLGERLAFERMGVRLYEAMIQKCEASQGNGSAGPSIPVERLREFRQEELDHFAMVKEVMESIGADPTAQTPDADATAVASQGVAKVILEPKTSLGQCLEALLTAEMTDNAGWELLTELCSDMGMDEIADRFQSALDQESEHMRQVKEWLRMSVKGQAEML